MPRRNVPFIEIFGEGGPTLSWVTLPTHLPQFLLRQQITLMINRYEIVEANSDGTEGALLAFAEQKRMALREEVTFFAERSKTTRLFSFKARQKLDVRAEHDVFDAEGNVIGWFKKEFGTSLLRSTWLLTYDGVQARGQERRPLLAILRRIWDFIPYIGEVWIPFVFHFDFVDLATGQPVLIHERIPAFRDRYRISVPDPRLDLRLAASMAVALDALQSR